MATFELKTFERKKLKFFLYLILCILGKSPAIPDFFIFLYIYLENGKYFFTPAVFFN